MEAIGNTQTVASGSDIAFQVAEVVGTDILFTPPGTTFIINRTGLYHLEWSINLAANNTAVSLVGTREMGQKASAMTNTALTGNSSSGVLIEVTSTPYTVTLHNYDAAISIADHENAEYTAASIRILRFADGPVVP